jgi:CRISPR/Cas system CSM-associated protein Csm3 (group 7 of RAMP superfamily)
MKSGKLIKEPKSWKLDYPGFKQPMTVQGDFGLTDDLHGKEVEFDNPGGKIRVIKYGGKSYEIITPQLIDNKRSGNMNRHDRVSTQYRKSNEFNNSNEMRVQANSPYNFVPLNDKVISVAKPPAFDKFHPERLSGYIDLTITTRSMFFIRGEEETFFKINGRPVIPGSSLRGMVRNLVEIVSYSKFKMYDNKRLSHRGLAETSSLKKVYTDHFLDSKSKREIKVGYLVYRDESYRILPAEWDDIIKEDFDEFTYENDGEWTIYSGRMSGRKPKKKHYTISKALGNNRGLLVPDEVITAYKNDKTKVKEYKENEKDGGKYYDLLARLERDDNFKNGVPVFYTAKDETIVSFGHTKNYRIPYERNIQDHVTPSEEHTKNEFDFAESIFGFLKDSSNETDERTDVASRVFFEDGKTDEVDWELSKDPLQPKVLSGPKPTSFQLYLKQKDGVSTRQSALKHWNDTGASIRGYKLYWHKKTSINKEGKHSWEYNENKSNNSLSDPIIPVKENVKFSSRIRFENLSQEELGCLLFVLDLPEGCCPKLGMGKPLGLGSVHITPVVTIINRQERYASLFDEDGNWNISENTESDLTSYKNSFAKVICDGLEIPVIEAVSLWDTSRFLELKAMLTLKQSMKDEEWEEKTSYMELTQFKERSVLPSPVEVIQATYGKK